MKEHFVISAPSFMYLKSLSTIFLSFILALIIIIPIYRKVNIISISLLIILTLILYLIFSSITNENLSNEMPSYLYPTLPHTGLDGISLQNYISGMSLQQNR
jgi:hypothetical protein